MQPWRTQVQGVVGVQAPVGWHRGPAFMSQPGALSSSSSGQWENGVCSDGQHVPAYVYEQIRLQVQPQSLMQVSQVAAQDGCPAQTLQQGIVCNNLSQSQEQARSPVQQQQLQPRDLLQANIRATEQTYTQQHQGTAPEQEQQLQLLEWQLQQYQQQWQQLQAQQNTARGGQQQASSPAAGNSCADRSGANTPPLLLSGTQQAQWQAGSLLSNSDFNTNTAAANGMQQCQHTHMAGVQMTTEGNITASASLAATGVMTTEAYAALKPQQLLVTTAPTTLPSPRELLIPELALWPHLDSTSASQSTGMCFTSTSNMPKLSIADLHASLRPELPIWGTTPSSVNAASVANAVNSTVTTTPAGLLSSPATMFSSSAGFAGTTMSAGALGSGSLNATWFSSSTAVTNDAVQGRASVHSTPLPGRAVATSSVPMPATNMIPVPAQPPQPRDGLRAPFAPLDAMISLDQTNPTGTAMIHYNQLLQPTLSTAAALQQQAVVNAAEALAERNMSNASSLSIRGDVIGRIADSPGVTGGRLGPRALARKRSTGARGRSRSTEDDDDDEYIVDDEEAEEEADDDLDEDEDLSEEGTGRKRAKKGRARRGSAARATPRPRKRPVKEAVNDGTSSGQGTDAVPKARSSKYRGVTRHRRSGRWEAHIWIKEIGRQVYLGGYENEEHAAEAYDVAALKTKGTKVRTNFPTSRYADLLDCMDAISLEELIMAVRRQSQGFSRGSSSYRGVTAHPSGRWESRIGVPGSKHVYLGLFNEEREAATAYDRALVRLRGTTAATNFALSDYRRELAEFHQAQQAVLLRDKRIEEVMQGGPEFEKWVKQGSAAFPFMAAAYSAAEGLLGANATGAADAADAADGEHDRDGNGTDGTAAGEGIVTADKGSGTTNGTHTHAADSTLAATGSVGAMTVVEETADGEVLIMGTTTKPAAMLLPVPGTASGTQNFLTGRGLTVKNGNNGSPAAPAPSALVANTSNGTDGTAGSAVPDAAGLLTTITTGNGNGNGLATPSDLLRPAVSTAAAE